MASAHPAGEHLAAYSSGALSDGMTLLVAAHLTYCPSCRSTVERFDTLAGATLVTSTAAGIDPPALDQLLSRLDDAGDEVQQVSAAACDLRVPFPLGQVLGKRLEDLKWEFRLPGIHEYEMHDFAGETVSLLKVRPGAAMLHHTHEGEEATLILTGAMEDGGRVYRAGDVALADHDDDHRPKVIGDDICHCLIVLSGNMRFTGPFGRVLNLFNT